MIKFYCGTCEQILPGPVPCPDCNQPARSRTDGSQSEIVDEYHKLYGQMWALQVREVARETKDHYGVEISGAFFYCQLCNILLPRDGICPRCSTQLKFYLDPQGLVIDDEKAITPAACIAMLLDVLLDRTQQARGFAKRAQKHLDARMDQMLEPEETDR